MGSSGAGPTEKIHESITAQMIQQDGEIASVLAEDDRGGIVALIGGTDDRRFEHDIVSGSLDADKMDYLLRDSHFAGVGYGQFDLDKIIDVCRIYRAASESYLSFDHEGIYALEQLVLAKYHMGHQVYFHRIRTITDAMLVRGLTLAVDEGIPPLTDLFPYDGSQRFLDQYVKLYDDHVLHVLSECQHEKVRNIFSRLFERRLLKKVFELPVDEVPNAIRRDQLSRLELDCEASRDLESTIASEMGFDRDFVIVYRQSIKNPTFRTPTYRMDEDEIMILDRSGTPRKISEYPDLTFSLNTKSKSRETLFVFAPCDEWDDPRDPKLDERKEIEDRVRQIILGDVA